MNKSKTGKKLLSLLLSVLMCLSFVPTVAFATEATEESAGNDGYVANETADLTISSEDDLFAFAKAVNTDGNTFSGKTVMLANDITLTKEWTPVGVSVQKSFKGTFDGDGHKIIGMKVNGTYQGYGFGFFKTVISANVKNVTFEDANVIGIYSNITGIVVGYSYGSSIFENVHVANSLIYAFGKVGGIVAYAEDKGATTTVKNCSVTDTTIHGGYNVAGFCGLVQGKCNVSGSYLKGNDIIIDENAQGFGALTVLDTTVICDGSVATCAGNGTVIKGQYLPNGGYYWSAYSDLYNHYGDSSHGCTLADGKMLANSEVVHDAPVAIGEVKYSDLAAAFDAANTGDTVTLLTDITLTEQVNITKALNGLTLDGNGKTITCATTDDSFKSGGSALYFGNANDKLYCTGIKIKDLNMVGKARFAIFLCGGTTTEFTNVNISGEYYIAVNLYGTHGATMTNCNISNSTTGTDKYISGVWSNVASANPLTLNDTTVDVIAINAYTTENTLAPKILINEGSKAEIHTFDDGSVSCDKFLCINKESKGEYSVKEFVEATSEWVDATVAEVGGVKYATLAAAIAAAKDGETVTLLSNCSGDGIRVPENKYPNGLTIDFAGHSYTVGGVLVGSSGTASNGFQLLKDNKITMKNGSIYGDKSVAGDDKTDWSGAPAILIQNYSDLTLDGMTVAGGEETAYTLSNNNGDTVIKDSKIIAGKGTKSGGPFAFDVCRFGSAYPSVSVTVKGNSEINGRVEISGAIGAGQSRQLNIENGTFNGNFEISGNVPANIAISGGKFANEIKADWCADGFIPVQNDNGTYGVKSGSYVAEVGGVKFDTLQAAFDAANTGDTITMLRNITVNGSTTTVAAGKETTLDLNGYILNGTNTPVKPQALLIQGNLTVTDSKGTGKICSSYTGTNGRVISVEGNGILTVNGGTVTTEGMDKSGNAVFVASTAEFNLNGGKIYADNKRNNYSVNTNGTFNMTGGSVIAEKGTDDTTAINGAGSTATINISDGEISGATAIFANASLLSVTGGSFSGKVSAKAKSITGGTFDYNVVPYLATGYALVENESGTYNVESGFVAQIFGADNTPGTAYKSFAEAVGAAKDGETVVLLNNVTEFPGVTISKNITVNFGAYTVTGKVGAYVIVVSNADVTLKGTTGGVNGGSGDNNIAVASINNANITIESGVYTVGGDANGLANTTIYAQGGNVTIKGGTFSSEKPYKGKYYVLNVNNNTPSSKITVLGGTFVNFNPLDGDDNLGGSFCPENVGVTYNDGKFTVSSAATVQVTHADGTLNAYTALLTAVTKLRDGDTVKLLKDISVSKQINVSNAITLDLNGKILTSTFAMASGATGETRYALLLKADVTVKNGTFAAGKARAIGAYGALTLDGVTVSTKLTDGNACVALCADDKAYTVRNSNINGAYALAIFANNATVNVADSVLTGNGNVLYHNGSNHGLKLTVSNTEITSTGSCGVYISGSTATYGEAGYQNATFTNCTITGATNGVEVKYTDLTLDGCTVKTTAASASYIQDNNGPAASGFAVVSTDNAKGTAPAPQGTITIKGDGNYTGPVGLASLESVKADYPDFTDDTIKISGGTFDRAVLAGYCANGYIPKDNGNGTYGVIELSINVTKYLTFGNDLTMSYDVKCDGYTVSYVEFSIYDATLNGGQGGYTVPIKVYADANGVFNFTGINPQRMVDIIKAVVYLEKDGIIYEYAVEDYSVKDYCLNILNNPKYSEQWSEIISNLVVYGAEAQKYTGYRTDDLVTKYFEGCVAFKPVSHVDKMDSVKKFNEVTGADGKIEILPKQIVLDNAVNVRINFKIDEIDISKVKFTAAVIQNGKIIRSEEFGEFAAGENGTYYFDFNGVMATELDNEIVFTATVDGTENVKLSYNVNQYLNAQKDHESFGGIAKALFNYGYTCDHFKS